MEPCFGIGHNLSLICQMASEDIKHQLIIIIIPRLDLFLFAPSAGTGGTNEANDGRVPVDPSVVGGSVHSGRPFVSRPRLAVPAAHQLPSPRALSGTLVVRTDSVMFLSGCMPTDSVMLLSGCMPTDSVVLLSGCMPTDSVVFLIGCMPTDSVVLLSGCMPIY